MSLSTADKLELDDLQRSLRTQTILRFYDFRYSVQVTDEKGIIFVPSFHKEKNILLFLFVTLLQYPLLRMRSEQSVRLFYLSKQLFLHATKINVVILHFMLSGSQEGIGLDPETLLSSSILVKKAFKTHYTYLPIFHWMKCFSQVFWG